MLKMCDTRVLSWKYYEAGGLPQYANIISTNEPVHFTAPETGKPAIMIVKYFYPNLNIWLWPFSAAWLLTAIRR